MTHESRPAVQHLNEDELVLHYYGEMSEPDDRRAGSHLTTCPGCHAQYRRLQRVLRFVDEAAVVDQHLPAHFERTVWARLEPQLQSGRPGFFAWLFTPGRLAWTAAVVVLVCAAFAAGRFASREATLPREDTNDAIRPQILLMDLSEHLDRSQAMLVELATSGTDAPLDLPGERARAEQLVVDNRLYRRTAASTGDASIVTLLDDLERLLVDLAASPEEMTADELAAMRQRSDAQGLLFKVRVLATEIRERQKSAVQARAPSRSAL